MHRFHPWALLLLLLFLAGCAQTIVPLRYQNLTLSTPPCSHPIAIGQIKDQRQDPLQIGATLKQTPFYAETMVDTWVRQALVSQLRAQGCEVLSDGEAEGSAVAVTGEVSRAWLRQISRTEYSGQLQIHLQLTRNGQTIHKESFKTEVTKRVVPKKTVPQDIMTELLQDLMSEMVPRVIEKHVTQKPG